MVNVNIIASLFKIDSTGASLNSYMTILFNTHVLTLRTWTVAGYRRSVQPLPGWIQPVDVLAIIWSG